MALGARRRLGAGPSHAGHGGPGARRARSFTLRGHRRQPDRQDGGSKGGFKGYDAGKKIHGHKRHILTDTDGRLLGVEVHAADIQDRDGVKGVLKCSRARFPFVETVFAHGGYAGRLVEWGKLIEDQEVEAGDQVCGSPPALCTGFCVKLVDQVDGVEESSPPAIANAEFVSRVCE